jgi:DNA-binding CsgD family transcriptional regulator/PAS domain-containing protein
MRAFEPTITVDEEIIPKRDLMRSEFYSDFLRPAGIHSVMTMGLWAQGVDVSALDVYRPAGRPGFSSADVDLAAGLHPHLVRAFRLSQKLADTRVVNDGLAAALDRAPYGLFILDADRRVRHVNAAGERMLAQPGGLGVLGGRLVAAAPGDTRRLEALIATAASGAGSRVGGSMIVRRPDGRAPLSVTTSPADAGPLSLFRSGPTVVVCVTDPEQAASVSEAQLREVFGLTPGQAKVAVALLEGRSAREAADALGLSFFTVRAHLARIFEKTGVNRQAELVALMTRMTGLTTD